jgi:hypothetical protein
MATMQVRPELEEMPRRMRNLPVDKRGYPVPWFVAWQNGEPEFRALDPEKWIRAVRDKLCWVCGESMGIYKVFVLGPMCGINRTAAEPPCHMDCARWSVRNCPFLKNPDEVRRESKELHLEDGSGFALQRNPGVTLLWATKTLSIFNDEKGKPLIHIGEPELIEWWCRGLPAKREEVLQSIEEGMPALMALALQQEGAVPYLLKMRADFEAKHLPPA